MLHRTISVPDFVVNPADEELRNVAFGEALRALTLVGYRILRPGPEDKTWTILERSYRGMLGQDRLFSPEDFALFFLSRFVDEIDPSQREPFRLGAAQYLIAKRARLSRDIAELEDEARALLEKSSCHQGRVETDRLPDVPGSPVAGRLDVEIASDEFVFGLSGGGAALLLTEPADDPI